MVLSPGTTGTTAGQPGSKCEDIDLSWDIPSKIEVQSVEMLILANTFGPNRGSKCENVDFS